MTTITPQTVAISSELLAAMPMKLVKAAIVKWGLLLVAVLLIDMSISYMFIHKGTEDAMGGPSVSMFVVLIGAGLTGVTYLFIGLRQYKKQRHGFDSLGVATYLLLVAVLSLLMMPMVLDYSKEVWDLMFFPDVATAMATPFAGSSLKDSVAPLATAPSWWSVMCVLLASVFLTLPGLAVILVEQHLLAKYKDYYAVALATDIQEKWSRASALEHAATTQDGISDEITSRGSGHCEVLLGNAVYDYQRFAEQRAANALRLAKTEILVPDSVRNIYYEKHSQSVLQVKSAIDLSNRVHQIVQSVPHVTLPRV